MSILISAHQLTKSFTSRPLFSGITFSIESGDRVGLIGPNGAGKSTLLKILSSSMSPDEGTLSVQKGLRVAYLEQIPHFTEGATVESSVMQGLRDPHDWEEISRAQEIMAKLSLSGSIGITAETPVNQLSGGWKKRVALARELLKQPDLFLIDEPTNHLDIESILWLEEFLANASFATVIITHDRLFLQRVSNRILEIDRRHPDGLLSVRGDYATYLQTREEMLATQELHEQKLRNTLRRETEWLRRGAKARQTKQQARIQNAGQLKQDVEELSQRNQVSIARLDFQSLEKNPKKLIEAKGITKAYNGELVLPLIDLLISPKSRLGLLGPNGSGKSTLLKILVGAEKPDQGSVFHADRLKVAYFEQNRDELDPDETVQGTICPKGDWVDYQGSKVHVKGYLSRFLFSYEQMGLAVRKLSGGEQSRLLLARLMLNEANVLILDEPTNDLDIATLEVLAEVLHEFNGAVILVTHDRFFLDQVTHHILAFGIDEKGGKILAGMAGLDQWEIWHDAQKIIHKRLASARALGEGATSQQPVKKKKLSFKEQREFDGMEASIQKLEGRLKELEVECVRPENMSKALHLAELTQEMEKLQTEITRLYARWAELER
jgi:ATP-binding cassette subfamily F protein uup